MALVLKNRVAFVPFRKERPDTQKIIFLSLEGSATEEDYFKIISELFSDVKSKIQFISVAEDAVHTIPKYRTYEQNRMLTSVRPKQLVERIEQFKIREEDKYQFELHPEDEFWIVTDVDKNWSDDVIDASEKKTYREEWDEAITICRDKNYRYAISNPYFEMWLLLHHDIPCDEDKGFAVTDTHEYEKTNHFKLRLRKLGVPLKGKHICAEDYDVEKVKRAIEEAEKLHINKEDLCPRYFATTVYLLLKKIIEL